MFFKNFFYQSNCKEAINIGWGKIRGGLFNFFIVEKCLFCIFQTYRGLWFNWTYLPLFQNMSVKIYTNFFLLSGYNFKINYSKNKMKHRMCIHILLIYLVSSPLQHEYFFRYRRSNCYEKPVKFHPEIFVFKVLI